MIIRQLAQCPYCQACEVALTDSPAVTFNPESKAPAPCPHLVYVEGRYSQYELSPLPGRKTKIARMIGSTEFGWVHPTLEDGVAAPQQQAFLKELTLAGAGWERAPAAVHSVQAIHRDQSITDENGRSYPTWEIEGAAVYARDADAFLENVAASAGGPREGEEDPFDFSSM